MKTRLVLSLLVVLGACVILSRCDLFQEYRFERDFFVSGLNCNNSNLSGTLLAGVPTRDAKFTVPYSWSNGGAYSTIMVQSSGVNGLTAVLDGAVLTKGSGILSFKLTGTPSGFGFARFAIDFAGSSCTVQLRVDSAVVTLPKTPVMKDIPAGIFSMGCTAGDTWCFEDESPVHSVALNAFQISETEVTQAQWLAVMGSNPSWFKTSPDCPVEQVSWFDALVFCNRLSELQGLTPYYYSDSLYSQVYGKSGTSWSLPNKGDVFRNASAKGYRLPTEAEWEYAARGGNGSFIYSGSNTIEYVAWYGDNSGNKSEQVRQKLPNGYGLYDMSGNVHEWCQDGYGPYPVFPQVSPVGQDTSADRIFRGGACNSHERLCRVTYRYHSLPSFRTFTLGFRIAL